MRNKLVLAKGELKQAAVNGSVYIPSNMNKQTKDLNMKRKTNNVWREREKESSRLFSILTVQCYQ